MKQVPILPITKNSHYSMKQGSCYQTNKNGHYCYMKQVLILPFGQNGYYGIEQVLILPIRHKWSQNETSAHTTTQTRMVTIV